MRLIIAFAITILFMTACSRSEVLNHQNRSNDCRIEASSIKLIIPVDGVLSDPTEPDFESNCGILPIFVQIFQPVQVETQRVGLSIEHRRAADTEQLSAPLPHSENPPYTEDVFAALLGASLAKLRSFKPVNTSVWQKNDSVDVVRVYVGVHMLEGNWNDVLSYVGQRLKSHDGQIITEDNIADQFGIADYYENSNLKKIACGVARDYHLECIKGTFKALNLKNTDYKGYSYKQMLETTDFGLDRVGTLKFELKPIHRE